jgi:hypothetical protein
MDERKIVLTVLALNGGRVGDQRFELADLHEYYVRPIKRCRAWKSAPDRGTGRRFLLFNAAFMTGSPKRSQT